jgi:hypothetical protein
VSTGSHPIDARLTGALSTIGNLAYYASGDGTCTTANNSGTVVVGDDSDGGGTTCRSLLFLFDGAFHMVDAYPAAPVNWWTCTIASGGGV